MNWINCNDCGEEFRVISESLEQISYCPFCGNVIEQELDEEEEEDF